MNKAGLIDAIAAKSGLDKKQSGAALAAMLEAVEEALVAGDRVQLIGFGTWSVNERSARTGRNPSNNEVIEIPAKNVVKFKPGASLAKAVN
ncbi:MAG: HU family DNA-binding protein [Chloroflexi bacterium]|nr:HU family DNA-binding protein [Chloroflexota bacterium]MCY3583587.1 HU family DNA-binding protein [Chloroflexota bacterium]MCY3715769.1 HU family DNA-binding protein [Chloroflexota bacterium]MDE2651503.1 HU family DNA-binding protein [Chloroflexota bacterium]MXV92778.1 HU family DNA-binding protein [Chloroflexota bacterium]